MAFVGPRRSLMIDGGSNPLTDGMGFALGLQTSIADAFSIGSGTPTFIRASAATVWGYGPTGTIAGGPVVLTVASGEARFCGARRIAQDSWSAVDTNGLPLTTATVCNDAGGPFGYLAESAATQIIPNTADIRDMTQVTWSAGVTMTVAKTATGADGAANAASTVTGGATAATNTITYLVTAAASSRTYSALVKLVSGADTVLIMQGATTSDITSQLVVGQYVLVQLNASVLNATIGFKINGTGGTVLNIDMNQFEIDTVATSRILTGGATRVVDLLTYPTAGNFSNFAGSAYAEFTSSLLAGAPASLISTYNGAIGGEQIGILASSNKIFVYDGTTAAQVSAVVSRPVTAVTKVATSWGGTTFVGALSGATITAGTFSGNMNFGANTAIGSDSNGTTQSNGTIRNVRIWTIKQSDAALQAMTTP